MWKRKKNKIGCNVGVNAAFQLGKKFKGIFLMYGSIDEMGPVAAPSLVGRAPKAKGEDEEEPP